MGKETSLEGKEVKKSEEIGTGYTRITFEDGTVIICQIVPLDMKLAPAAKETKESKKEEKQHPYSSNS